MLLDLDKFYNSNYKDFVHKEALEEALKYVPEAFLKDVDTKAILSITFSVDDVGENPIYVTYLDKDNKEHIVKLRPNITEQLTEVLKRYPTKAEMQEALGELKTTITNEYTIFVNAEVESLNNTINNVNNSLTQSIKDTLDEAKHYTDTKHDEALAAIEEGNTEALAVSKDYTDRKNQETQVGLKNYTDTKHEEAITKIAEGDTETLALSKDYTNSLKEELAPLIAENKNRLYIGNADNEKVEIEKTGHVTFEVDDGIKAIEVKQNNTEEMPSERIDFDEYAKKSDIPTNTVTTDYLNEQLENYETRADAFIDHNKLSEVPNGHKNPYISWYPDIDSNYIRLVNDNGEVRLHINNSQTDLETIGYLSSRNPADFATKADVENANKVYGWRTDTTTLTQCQGDLSINHDGSTISAIGYRQTPSDNQSLVDFNLFATKSDITPLESKLQNIWGGHKAPFIYWLPNIDINTIKLENTDSDVKAQLNDSDVVYWSKTPTETPVNITTQGATTQPKLTQKDLNFVDESSGNARLYFDNNSQKYYVGKDYRVIHTDIAGTSQYPVTTKDLNSMKFTAFSSIISRGTRDRLVNNFYFDDPFNADVVSWKFNTAPITGSPLTQPALNGDVEWHQNLGFATGDYLSKCAQNPVISEWTMRLLKDTCGVLGWSQNIVTGSFIIGSEALSLNAYFPDTEKTFHELTVNFTSSIESWASRSIQVIPAQIKFNFNGNESTFISCFAKIENKTLTLDNFDERKLEAVCQYANDHNLNGTAGDITIRLNGGY